MSDDVDEFLAIRDRVRSAAKSLATLMLMVAALELYFDTTAELRIRRLWDALEHAGVQTLRDQLNGRPAAPFAGGRRAARR